MSSICWEPMLFERVASALNHVVTVPAPSMTFSGPIPILLIFLLSHFSSMQLKGKMFHMYLMKQRILKTFTDTKGKMQLTGMSLHIF